MKRTIRPAILTFALILLLAACEEKEIEERLPKDIPKIVLEKLCLTETKSGQKLWTLNADRAGVYDEIIKADSVTVLFYDELEKESSVLKAPRGELNTRTHNIFVTDSVVVITSDSTKLYTDSLFWLNDSAKILTDAYVKIYKGDGTVIEGRGLRTDPRLTRIEIIGETKGVSPIKIPDIRK
ncbi:MAG: LPS export ABC transporter periplasmic protein LptC [candidate division WOR-3 bacterium]|nr:MAG: LPS export ABC transporter periplasmic protein LptC [candidate division WOR-3 bacterium]